MKFALINDQKVVATTGTKGFCPSCGSALIAKCGEVNVNHWAHKGRRNCDPWWENESEWHRAWKDKFPVEWQEIIQHDDSGEKHIADVKTQSGYVLEFQHSYLNPEERRSRNAFYNPLVWIVDGSRRKTDKLQFQKALDESTTIIRTPPILRINRPDECRLLKEWHDRNILVFFDFQKADETKKSTLWFLFPKTDSNEVYISLFSRQIFIELHNENKFDEMVNNTILPIHNELAKGFMDIRSKNIEANRSICALGFENHMRYRQRKRRRL